MMKPRTRRALALAASAVALSAALSGCSVLNGILSGDDAARDDDGNVTEEKEIDIFSLKVGDCLTEDAVTGGETDTAPVTPCDKPHPYEVYYEFKLEDGDFPGSDGIEAPAMEKCTTAFEEFIGVPFDASTLTFTWFEPTEESWGANDRLVQCIVYDEAGDVTGSLKGAAR